MINHTNVEDNCYSCPKIRKDKIQCIQSGRKSCPKPREDNGQGDHEGSTKPADAAGLAAMLSKLALCEKNTKDGEASAWAGQFATFLRDCPKD